MSEWKRHRGSKSMPKCLDGKKFEVRLRDGMLIDGEYITAWDHLCFDSDVMAYKILPSEPAAEPASKTAIELQAEEVGIPEPVQLVDDSQPDSDGWIEWKGGECPVPKGTLVDVRYRVGREEYGIPALEFSSGFNRMSAIDWTDNDAAADITAYRLHQPQEWPEDRMDVIGQNGNTGEHYADAHQSTEADNLIDNTAQKLREAFGSKVATTEPVTAPEFLQSALSTLTQRGKDYDKPEGERSAAAVAVAFNAITGKQITDAEVYLVLQLVKDVRQWQCADFHADSALDCVAYAALKA